MIFTSEEDLQMIIQAIENEDYQDAINLIKEIIEEEKIYQKLIRILKYIKKKSYGNC